MRVQRAGADNAHHIRNMDGKIVFHFRFIGNGNQIKRGRCRLGVPHRFHRRNFGLLGVADGIAGLITQYQCRQNRRHAETGADAKAFFGKINIALFEQIPSRNRHYKHRSAHITGRYGVHKFVLRFRIKKHLGKAGHFHAHGFVVEYRAHRILHPAVGHQNPQGRQAGAQRHKQRDQQMLAAAHAIPAKKEQPHQGGFQKKRHQAFNRQRRAENIAHIMRVIRPVGAELEFHGDAGGHPQRKINAKQLAPEFGHVFIDLAAGHHIHRLHNHQNPRQPQGERHKQKVVQRRHGKL